MPDRKKGSTKRKKLKIAMSWAGSCGGCDVSLLDIEEHLMELTALADVVYWPVAMDYKKSDLEAQPDGAIDFGLFNGAVRTSEHAEYAKLLRRKSKVLVAYGSCACFGGIPGLANLALREELLDTAYRTTPSTDNPEDVVPAPESDAGGHRLTLPAILETVGSLPQEVPVDVLLPGCPPPTERILDLVKAVSDFASSGSVPPEGTVLAFEKALCEECPRNDTRTGGPMSRIARPQEGIPDPNTCFIDQGMICMGIATRGGCGATCIQANMPCRGCFGPTADMLDPGAEAMSAIGSVAGAADENDVAEHEMKKVVRSIRDPAGTFYRFTLPVAFLNRIVHDEPEGE
jgi:F420-non-reducing hydrogenase small subunit